MAPDRPFVEVTSRAQWRAWLAENHAESTGIWLVTFKRGRGPQVPYDDVVEEALCFGWVDSQARAVDDDRSAILLTPRRPRSAWAATNKARVERLVAAGLMAPAGLAVVEAAKANGQWNALDDVERLVEPDDLAAALDADPRARASWDGFPPSARRLALEWLRTARREETRARRLAQVVADCAAGVRPLQQPRR